MFDRLFPRMDGKMFDLNEPAPRMSRRRAALMEQHRRARQERGEGEQAESSAEPEVLYNGIELRIAPQLMVRLEGRNIHRHEILKIIEDAEKNHTAFEDRRSGHMLASWRPSNITYWVEYTREKKEFGSVLIIYDAYSHRMIVSGTDKRQASH